jgi:hypothetical protein
MGRGVYRISVAKPEGKRTLENQGVEGDNIRMDLQEEGSGDVDWIELAQDRDNWRTLVKLVINLRIL